MMETGSTLFKNGDGWIVYFLRRITSPSSSRFVPKTGTQSLRSPTTTTTTMKEDGPDRSKIKWIIVGKKAFRRSKEVFDKRV